MPTRTPAPTRRPPLSPWDHLVLIGWQIKYNLEKAQQKWELDFRDQLKTYLMSRPEGERELTSADVIKIAIVAKGGGPSLNTQVIEESFNNMLRNQPPNPQLNLAELLTLFTTGALGVKNHEVMKTWLTNRGIPGEYMRPANPNNVTHSLTWKVLHTEAPGGAGILADLPERVHTASGARLDDDDIALMLPRAQPLTEPEPPAVPQASETVAVRRPRRTRGSVQPPEQP